VVLARAVVVDVEMSHHMTYTICDYDDNETEIDVSYTIHGGSPGSYWEPPEPPEVEIVSTDPPIELTAELSDKIIEFIHENHEADHYED
jgi:NADPH-dependent ferric siderophore reductase